jgi:hypothetical protein
MHSRTSPLPLALVMAGSLLPGVPAWAQAGHDPSFNLVNRADTPVRELFVTPSGDPNWGKERLRGHPIAPGGVFPVQRRADGHCRLDIKVVFADRRTEERRDLDTCTIDAVAVGGPEGRLAKTHDDPSFRLVNRGAADLREFYVTPSGLPHWGHNRLPESGLPAGTATVIRMPRTNECFYDLRAVFADHKALEQRHEDLCRITDVPVP